MVIEFARNVCGLEHANSTEFDPATPDRVIYKLRELKGVDELGGTMRLGAYPCLLAEGSFARQAYGKPRDQRAPPPSLRIQSRVRADSDRQADCASPARLRTRVCRNLRDPGSSLVPRLPVPSGIQIQAAGAASAVLGLHRRGAQASQEPHQARSARALRAVHPRRLSTASSLHSGAAGRWR